MAFLAISVVHEGYKVFFVAKASWTYLHMYEGRRRRQEILPATFTLFHVDLQHRL